MKNKKTWMVFAGILFTMTIVFVFWKFVFPRKDIQNKLGTTQQNEKEAAKEPRAAKLYEISNYNFEDAIEGLIGTVKGDTLELTFGGQEEKLNEVRVKVGEFVQRGQTLFELDHTRALSRKTQADIALNRAQKLAAVGGATAGDVKEAQAAYNIANKDYEDTFIFAPSSGTVCEINKQIGETVNRNEVVGVMVSAEGKFYIETGVIEGQIEYVRNGQPVYIKIDALGQNEYTSQVIGISKEVTTTGRTGTVHISIPEYLRSRLRPGLSAQCKIVTFKQKTIVIPRDAYDAANQRVFAVKGSTAASVPVTLGYTARDYYQVTRGLNDGDKIIYSLVTYPVTEGDPITPIEPNMKAPGKENAEKAEEEKKKGKT